MEKRCTFLCPASKLLDQLHFCISFFFFAMNELCWKKGYFCLHLHVVIIALQVLQLHKRAFHVAHFCFIMHQDFSNIWSWRERLSECPWMHLQLWRMNVLLWFMLRRDMWPTCGEDFCLVFSCTLDSKASTRPILSCCFPFSQKKKKNTTFFFLTSHKSLHLCWNLLCSRQKFPHLKNCSLLGREFSLISFYFYARSLVSVWRNVRILTFQTYQYIKSSARTLAESVVWQEAQVMIGYSFQQSCHTFRMSILHAIKQSWKRWACGTSFLFFLSVLLSPCNRHIIKRPKRPHTVFLPSVAMSWWGRPVAMAISSGWPFDVSQQLFQPVL